MGEEGCRCRQEKGRRCQEEGCRCRQKEEEGCHCCCQESEEEQGQEEEEEGKEMIKSLNKTFTADTQPTQRWGEFFLMTAFFLILIQLYIILLFIIITSCVP